jgi:hypothetical protein
MEQDLDINRVNDTKKLFEEKFPVADVAVVKRRRPGRPKQNPTPHSTSEVSRMVHAATNLESDKFVWTSALCAAINNFQVRTAADITKCAPIADQALVEFKKRWK